MPPRWLALVWLGSFTACGARTPQAPPSPGTDGRPVVPAWQLHASGVGELVPGAPIPDSVYARVGSSFEELWTTPTEGLDEIEKMQQGYMDQQGSMLVTFEPLDVRVKLSPDHGVIGIWVGPTVRTAQGTGGQSTLTELESAHGPLSKHTPPEPYHCAVVSPTLPQVHFLFTDVCEQVGPDHTVEQVFVGAT